MENLPDWYKLIFNWCRKHKHKGYGLTLPFLVGGTNVSSIAELLTNISDAETPEKVIIRFCHDRHEYVLALDDSYYPVSNHLTGTNNLLYDDDKIESFKSFAEVVFYLSERYLEPVTAGFYSKNMKTNEWETFSKEDISFMNDSLTKQ